MSAFVTAFAAQMMAIHAVNAGNGFKTDGAEFYAKLVEEVVEVDDAMSNLWIEAPNIETARMNLTVELADVCIAIMFYCAGNNLPLAAAIEAKNLHNATRGWKHGKGE